MFTSAISLIFFIGVTLTGYYPLLLSLRDDVAFDAFENYQNRVGGYESYLFFFGMQIVPFSLLVAARILYGEIAQLYMLIVLIILCG